MSWAKINVDLVTIDSKKTFSPDLGFQTVKVYTGEKTAIESLAAELATANIKFSLTDKEPYKLEVTYDNDSGGGGGGGGTEKETWDLEWQEETTALRFHNKYVVGISDAVKAEICIAEQELAEKRDFKSGTGNPLKPADIIPTRYTNALTQNYVTKRLKGIDTWTLYRPILIQRISCGTESDVQASNANVNKVQAVNPNSTLNKLGDEIGNYQWLKLPAKKRMTGSRIEIEQTYLGADSWDSELYS